MRRRVGVLLAAVALAVAGSGCSGTDHLTRGEAGTWAVELCRNHGGVAVDGFWYDELKDDAEVSCTDGHFGVIDQ